MGAVVAREAREEAEREAARVAAELERAAAEMERRAFEEAQRLQRELEAEGSEAGHPDGSNGHDPATSRTGQGDNIDSVVAADETTSQSGHEEGNSPGI